MTKYPCPCCGYLIYDEEPGGSYDICPICFWEDDPVQFSEPNYEGGANGVSLREAQKNFEKIGAKGKRILKHARKPRKDEIRDPNWKPIYLEWCDFYLNAAKKHFKYLLDDGFKISGPYNNDKVILIKSDKFNLKITLKSYNELFMKIGPSEASLTSENLWYHVATLISYCSNMSMKEAFCWFNRAPNKSLDTNSKIEWQIEDMAKRIKECYNRKDNRALLFYFEENPRLVNDPDIAFNKPFYAHKSGIEWLEGHLR